MASRKPPTASQPPRSSPAGPRPTMRGVPQRPGMMLPLRVWDLPVRLFHWLLVALVLVAWASVDLFDNMRVHMLTGQVILALLLFRLVWGFVGSDTARFVKFLRSPVAGLRHLRHFRSREPDTSIGHNEAGGWMVLALLAVLLAQVATGLFANNEDSFVEGPLSHLVPGAWGEWSLELHEVFFTLIQIFVALHILAVVAYAVVKRHDLVRPMITGKKRLPAATAAPRLRSSYLALAILAVCAALVWAAMNLL